jgi:hypothetical protein
VRKTQIYLLINKQDFCLKAKIYDFYLYIHTCFAGSQPAAVRNSGSFNFLMIYALIKSKNRIRLPAVKYTTCIPVITDIVVSKGKGKS